MLVGGGTIRARRGGNAIGGRRWRPIAVYAPGPLRASTTTQITGAEGGAAGTVYLRDPDQPHGTLIIDAV